MKLIIINEKQSRLILLETAKGKTGTALTSSLREDARGKDTTSDKVKRWAEIKVQLWPKGTFHLSSFTYYLEIPRSKPASGKKYFQFIILSLENGTLLNLSITEIYARSVIIFAHAPLWKMALLIKTRPSEILWGKKKKKSNFACPASISGSPRQLKSLFLDLF